MVASDEMRILGIQGFQGTDSHDASAALVVDGELVVAAEEERFARIKGSKGMSPIRAIEACLRYAGIALDDLGNLYQSKRDVSGEWKRRARLHWNEFVSIVGVKTAREITAEQIERYHEAIFDATEEKNQSPTYVKQRFGMVKSILNYAMTRGRDQADMRRILDFCKMLVPPKSNAKNPQPISPEHFQF